MATNDITEIDGSFLEGGGQILRNSASLSCMLCKDIRVSKIRAGRSNPGLRAQHLSGLKLIENISNGKLSGGNVGSTEVILHPSKTKSGSFLGDTKTAGSICLLMQAALPCLLYADADSLLTLRGGTNAEMAPQIDHTIMVFKPVAEKFGMKFDCDICRRGYFPKGGGEVKITVHPSKCLTGVTMTTRGNVTRVFGQAFTAGFLPVKIAHIMARSATEKIWRQLGKIDVKIDSLKEPESRAVGTGTGIIIVAETDTGCLLAGSALGKKNVPAEKVGEDAANMLIHNINHGGCVDDFTQDQLILLMAIAKGPSKILTGPITLHTQTAIHIAEQMSDAKFKVEKISETTNEISCEGIGHTNSFL